MSGWTDQIIDRAAELIKLGASAGTAAARINAEFGTKFSRNALIGKLRRMHISLNRKNETTTIRLPYKPRVQLHVNLTAVKRRARSRPPTPVVEIVQPSGFLSIAFNDLEYGMCRYPRGDVPAIFFCGQKVRNIGESWCIECRKIVYNKYEISDEERQRRAEWGKQLSALNKAARRARAA